MVVFAEKMHGNLLAVEVKSSLGKDAKARCPEKYEIGRRTLGVNYRGKEEYP